MTISVHAWLRSQIAFDVIFAQASSKSNYYSTTPEGTETGEHWRWECRNCDTAMDPVHQYLTDNGLLECPECNSMGVDIRSIERYELDNWHPRGYPHVVTHEMEEVPPVLAIHIVLNDPASVIIRAEAFTQILDHHKLTENQDDTSRMVCGGCGFIARKFLDPACPTILQLASVYKERHGYRGEWTPGTT